MSAFVKIEKTGYLAISKHLALKDNRLKPIADELDARHGNFVPSFSTVNLRIVELKRGRISLSDSELSWRSQIVTTNETIAQIHQMMLDER